MSEPSQFLLYTAPDGAVKVEVFFKEETVWLTQKALADLFGVDRSVITKHLRNIFKEGELSEDSVCAKFAHTASDGKTYHTNYYNLEAKMKAEQQYEVYRQRQDAEYISDFDREIKRIEGKKP